MKQQFQRILNYLFIGERKQLILFFLVGGINTLFGYFLYALLIFLHLHFALASLLGTIGGVMFNFKTTGIIVFNNHDNRLIFKFIAVYATTYLVNVSGLKLFSIYNTNMYLAGAVLVLPVALLGYVLQKKFVFGGTGNETDKRSDCLL